MWNIEWISTPDELTSKKLILSELEMPMDNDIAKDLDEILAAYEAAVNNDRPLRQLSSDFLAKLKTRWIRYEYGKWIFRTVQWQEFQWQKWKWWEKLPDTPEILEKRLKQEIGSMDLNEKLSRFTIDINSTELSSDSKIDAVGDLVLQKIGEDTFARWEVPELNKIVKIYNSLCSLSPEMWAKYWPLKLRDIVNSQEVVWKYASLEWAQKFRQKYPEIHANNDEVESAAYSIVNFPEPTDNIPHDLNWDERWNNAQYLDAIKKRIEAKR